MRGSVARALSLRKKQELSGCDQCQKRTLSIDMYRRPFHLFLPDNQSLYRSFLGAMLSIMTILLLSSYALWKLANLINRKDYTVRMYDQENFYDIKESFGPEDGFMLAAGLTAYDGNQEDITDLSIGRLRFIKKSFSYSEKGIQFKDVQTRPCNQTELLQGESTPSSGYFKLA